MKQPIDIHRILFKYEGCMCSVNGFAPRPLNTCYIDNVQAGAKIILFLRPFAELADNDADLESLVDAYNEMEGGKIIHGAGMLVDEIRRRGYDLDHLFEQGYAMHVDMLNIY